VDVTYVRETKKAILIAFNSMKTWIPKAWIARIQRNGGRSSKIKMSDYDWAKKFI
jgi:hypothetical protein